MREKEVNFRRKKKELNQKQLTMTRYLLLSLRSLYIFIIQFSYDLISIFLIYLIIYYLFS